MTNLISTRWLALLRARHWTLFRPILSGATLRDRMMACIGAAIGIGLTGLICGLAAGRGVNLPLLIAPMGASSVLVFAVPSSPLAQPWPAIGGNVISAVIGIAIGHLVSQPVLAAGLAAGLAIAVMSFTRSLHPPGGATALVAAFGGSSVLGSDLWFPLVPVGVNACLLVATAWVFHKLARNSYPHVPGAVAAAAQTAGKVTPQVQRVGFKPEDIDAALEHLGEAFDISRDDLEVVLREVETQALASAHGPLTCADIMSRDVVTIDQHAVPAAAHALLVAHEMRELPVIDAERRLVGSVGLKQLARPAFRVMDIMTPPATAGAATPAIDLIRKFADRSFRPVTVVDDERHLIGVITEADLLAAMTKGLLSEARRDSAA